MNTGAYNQLEQTFTLDDLQSVATLTGKKNPVKKTELLSIHYTPASWKVARDQKIYIVNWLHKKPGNGYLIKTWEATLIGLQNLLPFKVLLQSIRIKPSIVLRSSTCPSEWCFQSSQWEDVAGGRGHGSPLSRATAQAEGRPRCSPGTCSTGASAEWQWGQGTGRSW